MVALDLEEVITSNKGLIRTIANRLGIDPDDLEQEISLKTIEGHALARYDPKLQKISSFLSIVARGIGINLIRRDAKHKNALPYQDRFEDKKQLPPDAHYELIEEQENLRGAINKLDSQGKYPGLAVDRARGMSYEQLSEKYEIPRGSVNLKMRKQKERIRDYVAP